MSKTIKIEELEREVSKILDEYHDDIQTNVKKIVDKAGEDAVKELKATSPRRAKNSRGYWKSWRKKVTKETADEKEVTVYSIKPGLPHLLEHGHAKRGGGRTKAIPHIAPVDEKISQQVENDIVRSIENG